MQLKSIVHVAMKIECETDKGAREVAAKFVAEYISDSLGGYRRKPRHILGQMAFKVGRWVPCVCFGAPRERCYPVAVPVPNPPKPKSNTSPLIRPSLVLSIRT